MRRILFCTFFFASLTACDIFDREEPVPTFVRIDTASLTTILNEQGANTHAITDVHVFANEQFVGSFELPATVPILEQGNTRLSINAGIKNNGLVSNRIIYPFYAPLLQEVELIPGVVTTINANNNANFTYFPTGLNFLIEDFESIGSSLAIDPSSKATLLPTNVASEVRSGNGAGKIEFTTENNYFFATTTWQLPSLPRGRNMYLEIDFRGDVSLLIGVQVLQPEFNRTFALGLTPRDQYTKVYIEIGDEVSQQFLTSAVKFYFEAALPPGQTQGTILMDNIKFIYPAI